MKVVAVCYTKDKIYRAPWISRRVINKLYLDNVGLSYIGDVLLLSSTRVITRHVTEIRLFYWSVLLIRCITPNCCEDARSVTSKEEELPRIFFHDSTVAQ